MDRGISPTVRQAEAKQAAAAVAGRHGLQPSELRILSDSNNTIVHLSPLPLVAKVCHTTERPAGALALRRELEIAQHLVRSGAPIVPPSYDVPPAVYSHGTHVLTFWQYREPDACPRVDSSAACRALAAVHLALATYRGPLPSFLDRQIKCAGRLLDDPACLPGLAPPDRAFLAAEHRRLVRALRDQDLRLRVLHGDPHEGNFLVSHGRLLVIDFESACLGPVEWDLSAFSAGGSTVPCDAALLALARRLRSLCAAVWCMARERRAPELARAGRLHLAGLQTGIAA